MVMPMSSNASNSMFEASDWDLPAFVKSCQEKFGVTPRPKWVLTEYGGRVSVFKPALLLLIKPSKSLPE
jgi:lysosomal Pro-X carboxypeptidase